MYQILITYFVLCLVAVKGQRVAPGVPPQHYQQPPPQYQQHPQAPQQYQQHPQQNNLAPGVNPQQYQQQQMQMQQQQQQQQQFQQLPVQHQQVPIQQVPVQQQVPVLQVPQGHGGGHHAPHGQHGQQVLHADNIQEEKRHIQEHMPVPIDISKMSEAELQFHYFKMHDSDNNNKLDGCELIKSLIHWHVDDETSDDKKEGAEEEKKGGTDEMNDTTYTDEKLSDIIDYVLSTMDLNKDGYVDYTEYRISDEKLANDNKL